MIATLPMSTCAGIALVVIWLSVLLAAAMSFAWHCWKDFRRRPHGVEKDVYGKSEGGDRKEIKD
jgi:hypothetical protein